jgi:hypothetical protein
VPKGHKESCCLGSVANLGTFNRDSSWVNIFLKRYHHVLLDIAGIGKTTYLAYKEFTSPSLNATKQNRAIVVFLNRFFGAADRGLWTFSAWKCSGPSWCRDYSVPTSRTITTFLGITNPR